MDVSTTYGSQVPYMPKKEVALIRAKVSLYELRAPGEKFFNQYISGIFGATAVSYGAGDMGRARADWRIAGNTGVIYDADSDGNAIAWMPDDPWWHNRLQLMLDPWLNAVQKHTPQGIVPGYVIQFEIQALRNVLRRQVPTFDVYVDGVNKDWFKTEEEAKAHIEDKKTYVMKMGPNGMIQVPSNKRKYEVRPGKMWEYKPEVLAMIDKNRGEHYGWTACMEFQKEWKPLVLKEYEKLKSSVAPKSAVAPDDIARAIASWGPDERARFAAIMSGKPIEEKKDDVVVVKKAENKPKKRDLMHFKKSEFIDILGLKDDPEAEMKPRSELLDLALNKFYPDESAASDAVPIPDPALPVEEEMKVSEEGEALVAEGEARPGEVRLEE